jgi:hypothetical protein
MEVRAHLTEVGNVQSPASRDEHAAIKDIVAVYWEIFNAASMSLELHSVAEVVEKTSTEEGVPTFCTLITKGENADWTSDINNVLPDEMSARLVNALYKKDMCDTSIFWFVKPMTEKLKEVDAVTYWYIFDYDPEFVMHYDFENATAKSRVSHSVFRITGSSAKHYVADFTVEQFGFDGPRYFFLPIEQYFRLMNGMKEWEPCTAVHEEASRCAINEMDSCVSLHWEIARYCSQLDWTCLATMEALDRAYFLHESAKAAFEEVVEVLTHESNFVP